MNASIKHSSETNEQYTPAYIIELVREVLGSIDLDPATSEIANQTVKAKEIITLEDGPEETFERQWCGNVFLNPPGGKSVVLKGGGFRSNPALFWYKLMHSWYQEKTTRAAIFLGFTLEVLQTTQGIAIDNEDLSVLNFPFCVTRKRVCFNGLKEARMEQLQEKVYSAGNDEKKRKKLVQQLEELEKDPSPIVPGDQPPHSTLLVLVPPLDERHTGLDSNGDPWLTYGGPTVDAFRKHFEQLGGIRV